MALSSEKLPDQGTSGERVPLLHLPKSGGEMPEFTAFKSTLYYSAGILVLPLLAFFFSKLLVFDGIFSHNLVTSNVCSAVCAILVLHVALGTFIYKAYSGSEKTTKKD